MTSVLSTVLAGTVLAGALLGSAPAAASPDLLAIKARRVLIGDGSELEHAVILVDGGKITMIGQDLPIVMPGLVNSYSS